MKTTGVIIARFQSPYLHEGHYNLIKCVKESHNKVVIILGVSPVKGSIRNPLDFYVRERMVKKEFPEIVVLPLSDVRNDEHWSANLDELLKITFPQEKFVLYGSRDSFIPYYSGKLEVKEIAPSGDFNGSNLRESISDKVMDSLDFRAGIIYAYYNTYPKVFPTVDIALFRDNYSKLLLGKKKGEGKWRLLGGFTDPTDENYEEAALRELHEECGPVEVADLQYVKSFKVEDWRYAQERDKILTLLFSCTLVYGEPKGSDDIEEVEWFGLQDINKMIENKKIVEDHFPLIEVLLNKYIKKLAS